MGTKEQLLDAVLFAIEVIAFIFSLSVLVWACRTLGLPVPERIPEFWQDLPTPANLEARLEVICRVYGGVGVIHWLTRRYVGVRVEVAVFQVLLWIRRPWGRRPSYDEMMERIERLPLRPKDRSLLSWNKEYSYIISGVEDLSGRPGAVSLSDLGLAGLLHFGITCIFLPEILAALFGRGWLAIIGTVFVYFLIRWVAIFWCYFLLLDAHIPKRERRPPSFTLLFGFFAFLYGVVGPLLL